MKYPLRNLLMISLGASCLALQAPQAFAESPAAPAKEKAAPSKKKATPSKAKPAATKHKRKEGKAPTAASLVEDMNKSVAFIAKSAKDKISIKSKEARPFWSGLKASNKAIAQLQSGIKAKDANMPKGLAALGKSVPQLAASWGVIRGSHKDLQVGRGVIALSKAYDTFLLNFGPSVARKKKGGEVTAAEKTKLAKARGEVAKLKKQLAALKGKAKPNSYELRMMADLLLLCNELDRLTGNDLNAYCKYLYQFDRFNDTFYCYGEIFEVWYPDYYKEWAVVYESYSAVSVEFTSESYAYYDSWDYSSASVTNYGDYYEATSAVSSITTSEESTFQSYTESYSEASATEEISSESSEINEDVAMVESENTTLAQEVEVGANDEDGDGVSDEADMDDDNDGVSDDKDTDDDGDGVSDADDADEQTASADDDASADDGDSNDDGVADDSGDMEEDSGAAADDGAADDGDSSDDGAADDGASDDGDSSDDGAADDGDSSDDGAMEDSGDSGDEAAADEGGDEEAGNEEAADDSGGDEGGNEEAADDGGGDE